MGLVPDREGTEDHGRDSNEIPRPTGTGSYPLTLPRRRLAEPIRHDEIESP